MAWAVLLRKGLCKFCDSIGTSIVRGVTVERLRPRCPALFLSGATPGPFYHSHPHVPREFDHLDFSMEAQVKANITTIHKIGPLSVGLFEQIALSSSYGVVTLTTNYTLGVWKWQWLRSKSPRGG